MTAYTCTTHTLKEELNKIKGGIIGFMIGDALGLPVAGIPRKDIIHKVGNITYYIKNSQHPLLYFLKEGQYGGNSRLLLATLQSILENKKYSHQSLVESLRNIAIKSKRDIEFSRWMGETVMKSLLSGIPSDSDSCTCIYRAIPIALLFDNLETVIHLSVFQSQITHVSPISLSASIIISYTLFQIKNNPLSKLNEVIQEAVEIAERKYGITLLTENLKMLLRNTINSLSQARKVFGTGSRANQVIPLSLYIIFNNINKFEKGILEGVNSFRDDTSEEIKRLQNLSYKEALIQCRGGDTNAIGGLVGCILGTINGYTSIHSKFKEKLEDETSTVSLINQATIL